MSQLGDCQGSSQRRGSPRQRQRPECRSPVRFVPNRLIDLDLGHGITVRLPSKYKDRLTPKEIKVFPVRHEEPLRFQSHYDCLFSGQHDALITDIYDIDATFDRRSRPFDFKPDDRDDITVCIKLKKTNPIYDSQEFTAHINVDGKWIKTSASYKIGTITFNTFQVDTFCVSCTPALEEFLILPSGGCFKSKLNPDVEIQFPENSVNRTEKIDIQILPADLSRVNYEHDPNDGNRDILAFSDCVNVLHSDNFKLLAPAWVCIPLKVKPGEWTDDYNLVGLHWREDGEIKIESTEGLADVKATSTGYNVMLQANEFTGRQHAVVFQKTSSNIIKASARVAVGVKCRCKILVFTAAKYSKTRNLRLECVSLKRIKEIIKDCEEFDFIELKQCRSTEFEIAAGERIRVDVGGCGKVPREIPKEHTFIPFLGAMLDNHISLPIDIVEGFGRSVFVNLTFTLLSRSKICVHHTHFDPHTAIKKQRRRRSRSPYRQTDDEYHSFGNHWIHDNGGKLSEYSDYNGNPTTVYQCRTDRRCPQIAIREATAISKSDLMSTGSINIRYTIADSPKPSPSGTPMMTTPDSSRPTSQGSQVRSSSSISRQTSLEVLLAGPLDESLAISRATPKFDNAAFGGKSLYKLAKKVSPNHTMALAVQLDLDATEVDHIRHQYRDNSVLANFKILVGWLSLEKGPAENALQTLCTALEEVGHNDLKHEFLLAFKENKTID